jgi:hypothetical protein
MPIRALLPAALFLAGLALSACDSSTTDPSSAGPSHPSDSESEDDVPNGTLVVAGKTIPIRMIGVFDDTTLQLAAFSNVAGTSDSGWIVNIAAKPRKNSLALPLPDKSYSQNGSVHHGLDNMPICTYSITAGSLHIDSWSETPNPFGKLAKMSGGAVITWTPDRPSADCSALNATVAFTNADASQVGP